MHAILDWIALIGVFYFILLMARFLASGGGNPNHKDHNSAKGGF